LILFVFVAFYNFRPLDHAVAGRTKERLLHPGVADRVELVEADALSARGGKKANRNRNETEGKVALPDCRSHDAPRSKCSNCPGITRVVSRRRRIKKIGLESNQM